MGSDESFQWPAPRSGYTLPVFACAGAIASLRRLIDPGDAPTSVALNLLQPPETAEIPIEQVAPLPDGSVLAITRSDPGDNLDLTRHTPIWSIVAWGEPQQAEPIAIEGGFGVGRHTDGTAAIYRYATALLRHHLQGLCPPGRLLRVTVVLPQGAALALRTSNAAFGVADGLSLLGTSGVAQPLSAPGQLEAFRTELRQKAASYDSLVFCIGENGLDLALQLGVAPERRIKTANWLGPLLVAAAEQGVANILLFGYHGKLIKLAGGIFHTHHHVADGRQEILTAQAAAAGVPAAVLPRLLASPTVEAGLQELRQLGPGWGERVYGAIATRIDQRAQEYVGRHCDRIPTIGCLLFDRQRQIIVQSRQGNTLLSKVLVD